MEAVLASRGEANAVFDILAVLQVGARVVWRGSRPGPRVRDQNGGLLGLERSGTWSRMGADNCEVESGPYWKFSPASQGSRLEGLGAGLGEL